MARWFKVYANIEYPEDKTLEKRYNEVTRTAYVFAESADDALRKTVESGRLATLAGDEVYEFSIKAEDQPGGPIVIK